MEAVVAHLEEVGHPLPLDEIVKAVMAGGFRSAAPFTDLLIQAAAVTFLLDPVPAERTDMLTELEVLHRKRHRAELRLTALHVEIKRLNQQIRNLADRLLGEP
jgi:hypothetical protein